MLYNVLLLKFYPSRRGEAFVHFVRLKLYIYFDDMYIPAARRMYPKSSVYKSVSPKIR